MTELGVDTDEICPGCKQYVTGNAVTFCHLITWGQKHQDADRSFNEESLIWVFPRGIHLHDLAIMPIGQERLIPTLVREVKVLRIQVARKAKGQWSRWSRWWS